VSTEYQEQASAIRINGGTTFETAVPTPLPVARETSRSINAHGATKHNSATVATKRPTTMLESQLSNRQMRSTSWTGTTDLYAHPNT